MFLLEEKNLLIGSYMGLMNYLGVKGGWRNVWGRKNPKLKIIPNVKTHQIQKQL